MSATSGAVFVRRKATNRLDVVTFRYVRCSNVVQNLIMKILVSHRSRAALFAVSGRSILYFACVAARCGFCYEQPIRIFNKRVERKVFVRNTMTCMLPAFPSTLTTWRLEISNK